MAIGLVVAVGALTFDGWYLFFRGDEPPPVSLDSALQAAGATTTFAGTGATPAVAAATTATTSTGASASRANPVGRWGLEPTSSFVGYRINEQLARVGANTAVGRTSTVAGELNFDGSRVTALKVTADMRNLRSDESRRDNFLRQEVLETTRFPEAVFVLVEPIAVSVAPTEGASMSATATGDLTVHGVTKRVAVPVEGKLSGGKLVVVGSTRVALADFSIVKPRVPTVLSIEDDAVIELSLVFAPAGA
jgi:polyisoprenoid-binding protein YceI